MFVLRVPVLEYRGVPFPLYFSVVCKRLFLFLDPAALLLRIIIDAICIFSTFEARAWGERLELG